MNRVNVYGEGGELAGWFDYDKAERWSDGDYNGNGSGGTGRGQAVLRTAGGEWVLQHWTNWEGQESSHEFITPERAQTWLLSNNEDAAVEKYFGEIEEERGPGRPEEGERITTRADEELRGKVDRWAADHQVTRAEAMRQLLAAGLDASD